MAITFNLQSTSATTLFGYNGGAIEYNGYLWVLGGGVGQVVGSYYNTVYPNIIRSGDLGVTWELVTSASNIGIGSSYSGYHAALVYDGYIWVIGGMRSDGGSNGIRRTQDGINYTYFTMPKTLTVFFMGACVHNGRLYICGGSYDGVNGSNDVYSTLDGTNWTTHHANGGSDLPNLIKDFIIYSFNDRLWIAVNSSIYVSDDDGSSWSLYPSLNAPSGGLAQNAVVAYGYVYVMNNNGNSLYYSENGGDFTLEYPVSGTSNANNGYGLTLGFGNIFLVGGHGNIGVNYGRTYRSITSLYYNSSISFDLNNIHSPSPAYLRLTDTSNVYDVSGGILTDYTRFWSVVNNRTSATTFISAISESVDFVLEGLYGDTFNVSLSAIF